MLKIEQFVEQHFGIKLMPHQLEIIAMIAAHPEEKFTIQHPTPKAAGKSTAYKAAIAYLQDGLKPVPTGSIRRRALEWALSGDTGISSETLCSFMTGSKISHNYFNAPSDAADRGRCIRLLKLIPEWISRLDEMKQLDKGYVTVNGDTIPLKEHEQSWTHQIPLIIKEGGFKQSSDVHTVGCTGDPYKCHNMCSCGCHYE